ncbi:rod shape-determining protein MreC [Desulfovibrionales bacterium]
MSLYSWNIRTGYLDNLATATGLQFLGWSVLPAKWMFWKCFSAWNRYLYLVGVEQENEALKQHQNELKAELARVREEAAEVTRLRSLMIFTPPETWEVVGAKVLALRVGPNAVLETLVVSKGNRDGLAVNMPAVTLEGVVGRLLRVGPTISTVLLLTDSNSRIAVLGQTHRTSGILMGRGIGALLDVLYVPLNNEMEVGELLVTSGMAGIFPKGLPVARVHNVEQTDISLFKIVKAELLVDFQNLEELLLLRHPQGESSVGG